jgi:hypothetical protein
MGIDLADGGRFGAERAPRAGCRIGAALLLAAAAASGAAAADLPQGLMLHFNFDAEPGKEGIADQSGRNHSGRVSGARWTASGKQGGGCEFASTGACVRVASTPALGPRQATFAAWFKAAGPEPADRCILEKGGEGGYCLGIAGTNAAGGGTLFAAVNGRRCLSDGVVADGAWHHGAATFDGEKLRVYVDGKVQKQTADLKGGIATNGNDLVIGMSPAGPAPAEGNRSFGGALDDVMIFDHALSAPEIQTVMTFVKQKFTKEQVARRLAELKELLDRGLILQDFYDRKVRECEVAQ